MSSLIDRDQKPQCFETASKTKVPLEGRRNVLITSALPYVNNVPHLGNIIGSVLSADVFSRYCRMRGYQSLYISGTDEYGTATEMKALSEGVSPRVICDKFYGLHKQIYDWFNIDFDYFGRTTTSAQTEIAQSIFLQIFKNGYTSTDTRKQLHCGNCKKFLADRYVNGICPHCEFIDARGDQCDGCSKLLDAVDLIEPKCVICGQRPSLEESKHIFLDLDRLNSELQDYVSETLESEDSHWSNSASSITKGWLKKGLEKRCITRDLQWGTPVPLEEFSSKVFYVWFDAPIGYLSITKSLLGDDWIKWWKNPSQVELFHFLGKDNVAFHSIIFPATLIATRDTFTRAKHICATEYLNYEEQKFSKSRGIGVFGDTVSTIGIPADVLRFYLLYMRPETQDTSFCWDDFMQKVNSELLANLGNFVLRALTFLANQFGGIQPSVNPGPAEDDLFTALDQEISDYMKAMEEVRMRDAIVHILGISRKGNQYMQAGQSWVLIKGTSEEKKRAETIIGTSANICVLLSAMLYPFMPTISAQIQEQCNAPKNLALPDHFIFFLKPGHKHNKPSALFTKLEPAKISEWKSLFGGKQQTPPVINGLQHLEPKPKSPTKGKKKAKMDNIKKNPLEMEQNGTIPKEQKVHQLYGEVMEKFQKAKKVFVATESVKLDNEIAELKDQIEQQRKMLGYSGDLFSPPVTPANIPAVGTKLIEELEVSSGIPPVQQQKQPKKQKTQQSSNVKNSETVSTAVDDSVDVGRLDLRVGRIIEAHKHPDADSLYVEKIDLGEENARTVVSGLVRFVPLEQLQNRLVVCLCNLKPAKMRGVESQAMVMCASSPEKVEILEVDSDCKPGDVVICEPFMRRPDPLLNPKKKVWESVAPDLSASEDGECIYKGHHLRVERVGCPLRAPTLRNVPVK